MNVPARLTTPRDLSAIVAHAYALTTRASAAYSDGTPEQESANLDSAADDARRDVRAKLAELGVDPRMLGAVL
jgi:hypothetical protein